MNKTLLTLLLLTVVAAAIGFGIVRRDRDAARADATPAAAPDYDFEAQDVLLRQMNTEGRLQFEVAAQRIVQLPDPGGIKASGLTLRHDPPGTAEGSPQRLVINAEEATLPADGSIVRLSGSVRAQVLPAGSSDALLLYSEALEYNLSTQRAYTAGPVQIQWGRYRAEGRGLEANIAAGELKLESGHGTIPF
jgi:LPS export ABC transporter protein LptC